MLRALASRQLEAYELNGDEGGKGAENAAPCLYTRSWADQKVLPLNRLAGASEADVRLAKTSLSCCLLVRRPSPPLR